MVTQSLFEYNTKSFQVDNLFYKCVQRKMFTEKMLSQYNRPSKSAIKQIIERLQRSSKNRKT